MQVLKKYWKIRAILCNWKTADRIFFWKIGQSELRIRLADTTHLGITVSELFYFHLPNNVGPQSLMEHFTFLTTQKDFLKTLNNID